MKNFPLDPAKFTKKVQPLPPEMAVEFALMNVEAVSRFEQKPCSSDDLLVAMQCAVYATRGLAYEDGKPMDIFRVLARCEETHVPGKSTFRWRYLRKTRIYYK